ncbi:pimelyl-ACP methyl ester esterase BioV [Sulfurimonas lithotrophica]|uniref:Pimelyl-ACP methyl ester esterase BioV n=1 Tax=Sulfurimonas lithotrophica TaxID=2590022 RepID=A0A5P8P0H0_9BACT|nr:pimelyl-ACP methyl ester esterase BioV [Sulfurimonas lithotrophica]QFR49216.1 pimelyl-ACP methyl ester esterase BioV [Sulfurimonas lithotrophica]
MKFFSGFSLQNESYLFNEYIKDSEYTVCGFSYGAIKAYEYALKEIQNGRRIDTLQLLSPAFFQSKDTKFKRLQLMAYRKNEEVYLNQFLNSCFYPYEKKIVERSTTVISELEELLNYEWDMEVLDDLNSKGINIEVYLGGVDAIVDAEAAKDFFKNVATVTYIKEANHFLQLS